MPGHETEYPDFSPAGIAEFAAEAAREALRRLDGLEPADDVDPVTLDAMRERLGLELEIHEAGWDLADLNNIASPAQDIRAIFDLMPTDTAEHWEHIAGRVAQRPRRHRRLHRLPPRRPRKRGRVAPRRQVRIVIEQTTKYAAEDGFFATLAAGGHSRRRRAARACRNSATPARRPPAAPTPGLRVPPGRTAARRPGEGRRRPRTLRPGVPGLPRRRGGPGGDLRVGRGGARPDHRGAGAGRRADPARRHHRGGQGAAGRRPRAPAQGHRALQAWMQELSDKAVDELAGVHFDIPESMRPSSA